MAVLTISRELGSGGREIGLAVAQSLAYEFVDKERILGDVRAAGPKWEAWGNELDEHCPSVWEKFDWSFRGFGALVELAVLSYAVRDRVVIVGRGGNFLLKGIPHAFRVRIVAPQEERMARICRREGTDREHARWLIERADRDRSGFLLALYGRPWDDPGEYDQVFDTGGKDTDEISRLIAEMLAARDGCASDQSRHELRMRVLAAKIKAGLLTSPALFVPVLDVIYDGKEIVMRGVVHNTQERKRVEEAARTLAEGRPFRNELHYRG